MPKYITVDDLAEIMRNGKKSHIDYIVVDVRDDDHAGGHIRGSVHVPSATFHADVDDLVKQTKVVPMIIFHCSLSQIRGPKAARVYEEARRSILAGDDIQHEVVILRDGFAQFQTKFKNDPDLVENYDADVWAEDWS